jgi:hypothetical protein
VGSWVGRTGDDTKGEANTVSTVAFNRFGMCKITEQRKSSTGDVQAVEIARGPVRWKLENDTWVADVEPLLPKLPFLQEGAAHTTLEFQGAPKVTPNGQSMTVTINGATHYKLPPSLR